MGSDDGLTQGKLERERRLEEIRRRAEEAEFKRIEDEEKGRKPKEEHPPAPLNDPAAGVRDRLLIALDRGKAEKASELIAELRALTPDDSHLDAYESRLATLEQNRPAPALDRQRITDLITRANSYYQQEKYQQGLETIGEALGLDPDNEEAKELQGQIGKARLLAEQIKAEDAKRREEEAAVFPSQVSAPPPVAAREKDVWGTPNLPKAGDTGFEISATEPVRALPPQPSVLTRVAKRVAAIRIPIKPLITVGGALALLVATYFVVEHVRNAVVPPRYSLMVLPAVPVGNDSTLSILATGWTEDIIRESASINEMRVIGATTSFAARVPTLSDLAVARSMGADHFLQLSIERVADGVGGDVTLLDTVSSKPVWSRHFQVSMSNLPGSTLEVIRTVITTLEVQLNDMEMGFFKKPPTLNGKAYEAYLQGRAALAHPEAGGVPVALQRFQDAVDADSNFSDAQSALGWAHVLTADAEIKPSPTHIAQATLCVQRAVSLGSRSAETFRLWGMTEGLSSHYDKAVERFEQAVSVSPSDVESQRRLAVTSAARGDMEKALKAAQRAVLDDPMNISSYTTLGLLQQFGGDYRSALSSFEKAMTLARDPEEYGSQFNADVLVYLHQADRAIAILTGRLSRDGATYTDYYRAGRVDQTAGKPKQDWQDAFLRAKALVGDTLAVHPHDAVGFSFLALVETRLGAFKEAIAASHRGLQIDSTNPAVLYNTARMYALQRDKAQALTFLAKAAARRFDLLALLDMDFFNLRSEPEFLTTITR